MKSVGSTHPVLLAKFCISFCVICISFVVSVPSGERNRFVNAIHFRRTLIELAKEMLTKHATLVFPGFERPFDLCTDVSDQQLGKTLVQDGKSLEFCTWKHNSSQLKYTVDEKELLEIIEEFKEIEGIIRG